MNIQNASKMSDLLLEITECWPLRKKLPRDVLVEALAELFPGWPDEYGFSTYHEEVKVREWGMQLDNGESCLKVEWEANQGGWFSLAAIFMPVDAFLDVRLCEWRWRDPLQVLDRSPEPFRWLSAPPRAEVPIPVLDCPDGYEHGADSFPSCLGEER